MDPDLLFVIGLVVVAFSIVSIVSSFSEGRPPRVAILAAAAGGGCIAYAMNLSPGGYGFEEIPEIVIGVVGRYLL